MCRLFNAENLGQMYFTCVALSSSISPSATKGSIKQLAMELEDSFKIIWRIGVINKNKLFMVLPAEP